MSLNGSRPRRRILHSSDLHLEQLHDLGCHSLDMLVDVGIMAAVDFVVICGDFFDSNRVKDDLVRFAVGHLKRMSVDTIIVPGNHDCLVPDSVYNRTELWKDASNVKILRDVQGETVDLPHLGISVWGKPLDTYGDGEAPLGGMPKPERNGHWHIAVAHGYFLGPKGRPWASFQITTEEIVASGRDYIALGDSHAFDCVASEPVKAYYSGSPCSGTDTVAIVDLSESEGVQVARYSLRELEVQQKRYPGSYA